MRSVLETCVVPLLATVLLLSLPAGAESPKGGSAGEAVIVVGDQRVSMASFEAAVRDTMRRKFYHGKAPEAQLKALPREVADQIVNDALALQEAKRRGIKPDAAKMQQAVQGYDQQYGNSANWKQNREQMLARVMPEIERRDLVEQLERDTRAVPAPAPAEVRTFYEAKKELFTEPEKLRMSLILLKVDPSSNQAVWDKAMEEGRAIHKRLLAGANFAELARLHSGEESASRGGDLGYIHRGMLPEDVQAKVDSFKVGEIQPPMLTLQGVAIMRLDERLQPKLRSFEDVKARAEDLLRRDKGEAAWKSLISKLRSQNKVVIREDRFAELVARLQ